MTQNKNQNILYTQAGITYIILQYLIFFQQADSNRYILKTLIQKDTAAIVQKVCILDSHGHNSYIVTL